MKIIDPQWIRIAGDSINIKEDKPEHWQAYLGDSNKKIPLINWRITGNATTGNYLPNASSKRDFRGLLAWLDVYGTIETDQENIATVQLYDPTTK